MTLPKLPPTFSRDDTEHGRLYCLLRDVREYGRKCFEAGVQHEDPYVAPNHAPSGSSVVDELMQKMGMR